MQVSLKPELDRFVRDQVTSGHFPSASDLLNDAVEAMKHQRELETSPAYVAYVRRALAEADADIEAGRVCTLDIETAKREVRQRFRGGANGQGDTH